MTKPIQTIMVLLAILGVACNDKAADHGGHAAPSKTAADTKAANDPHAGHVMPTDPQPGKATQTPDDPHAGHAMPPATDGTGVTYDLVLSNDPKSPTAKTTTKLVFDPRAGNERVQELSIVHEKPLHLIVVSRDLSFFAHEHPARQADGTYALDFAFPAGGSYVLFGDFTPEGAAGQIVRMSLEVAGDPAPDKPLVADDRVSAKTFGKHTVKLAPASIAAGGETALAFTIEKGGKPVTGLRPYLGAMGHCVVIDETAAKFLHSHPQEAEAAAPSNVVQFHTVFPEPGKYKVWGQFDVGGEMLVADFVVDVGSGTAAAADPHAKHPH